MEAKNERAPVGRGAGELHLPSDGGTDHTTPVPPVPDAAELADRLAVGVPNELRALKGWLLWKRGQAKPGGEFDKVPYYAPGGKRFGTQGIPEDLAKLATFDVALARLREGGYDGLGLPMLGWGVVGPGLRRLPRRSRHHRAVGVRPLPRHLCGDFPER